MSDVPSHDEREALIAIARVEKGSWEVITIPIIDVCMQKGWVEFSTPDNYRLTEAGREALRRAQK